jgi:aminoglycoside 6'-N-acetyltransferase
MRPFTAKLPDAILDAGGGVAMRALRPEDEPFLEALLAEPEVSRWFEAEAEELIALIGDPTVSPFTIRRDGAPAGYAQVYWANGDRFWRDLGMPSETMGFDLCVLPKHLNQGLGPRAIAALIARVFAMERVVQAIIDPDPDNARAIRAFSKCGFAFSPPQTGYYGEPMALGVLSRATWAP